MVSPGAGRFFPRQAFFNSRRPILERLHRSPGRVFSVKLVKKESRDRGIGEELCVGMDLRGLQCELLLFKTKEQAPEGRVLS
jgi:hypothetical protein